MTYRRQILGYFLAVTCIISPVYLDANVVVGGQQSGYATDWSEGEVNARIGDLERTVNNFLHQAEQAERDAKRLGWRDRGYAMHLRNRADWLRGRAQEAQQEIDYLRSLQKN